jgi:uncharacterized membrane protein YkgB
MQKEKKLSLSLLLLRLGVFIVMIMWTLDKFINPEHTSQVFQTFYLAPAFGPAVSSIIGVIELVIVIGFLIGALKTFTYGAILILHLISTLASFKGYLAPYQGPHLLFFAAWPMLAACIALFLLRDDDTMLSLK